MKRRSIQTMMLAGVFILLFFVSLTPGSAATTFEVDTTSDDVALDACTVAAADCSLMGAVAAANANAGEDVITFNIPSSSCPNGVCRVTVADIFVNITEAVTIDGTTQPQYDGPQANVCATATAPSRMRIEVLATNNTSYSGIFVNHTVGSTTIRGLSLGMDVYEFGNLVNLVDGAGHVVACNHLGLDAAGTAQLGGVVAQNAVVVGIDTTGATIGTNGDGVDDVGERNVIGSANSAAEVHGDGVVFAGNWVGLGTDGTTSLPVPLGVEVYSNASNLLVGSNQDGISDEIERNYITNSGLFGVWAQPAGATTATDWKIVGNTFSATPDGGFAGVTQAIDVTGLAAANTGFEIRDNYFYVGTFPIAITGTEAGSSAIITGNWFGTLGQTIGGNGTVNGVVLAGSGSYLVAQNWFHNAGTALSLADSVTLAANSEYNCLTGNVGTVLNTTGVEVTFENNWWADASGPSGDGPGTGLPVSADVDYDPWLLARTSTCNNPPTAQGAVINVGEFSPPPNAMGRVSSNDVDGDVLSFSITGGNQAGAFEIDSTTGDISQILFLDYETTPSYSLTIEVTDGTDPIYVTWTINVIDGFETPTISTFTDITTDHQFFREIEYMAWADITLGCNADGTQYCPADTVTRAQMGSFLARALKLDPIPGDRFGDVSGTHEASINAIAEAGITLGCNSDGTLFCPNDEITRAQMGSFLARAFDLDPVVGNRFSDVSGTHEANINAIAEAGITLGCDSTGTVYCPNVEVTRAQMAAFIFRGLFP